MEGYEVVRLRESLISEPKAAQKDQPKGVSGIGANGRGLERADPESEIQKVRYIGRQKHMH